MDQCRYCGRTYNRFAPGALISEMLCSEKCFREVWHNKEREREAREVLRKAEEERWNSLSQIEQEAELIRKEEEARRKEEEREARRKEEEQKAEERRQEAKKAMIIYMVGLCVFFVVWAYFMLNA